MDGPIMSCEIEMKQIVIAQGGVCGMAVSRVSSLSRILLMSRT
jgi:hypothetical protein